MDSHHLLMPVSSILEKNNVRYVNEDHQTRRDMVNT